MRAHDAGRGVMGEDAGRVVVGEDAMRVSKDEDAACVVALLDDAARARAVIDLSSAVARELHRPLEIVLVESAASLLAAALPFTQVLAPGAARWMPLSPQDVEAGYRAQARRVQALAEHIARPRAVRWTLRVTRGVVSQVAFELQGQADLLLLGGRDDGAGLAPPMARRPRIAVVTAPGPQGERALQVARQVAQAVGGVVQACEAPPPAGVDLIVLPRAQARPGPHAAAAPPVLVVG